MDIEVTKYRKYERIINILSVVIPFAVAALLGIPQKIELGAWTKKLPHVIGVINTLTSILLIIGFYHIKNGNREGHRKMMTGAFLMGAVFLVCYILYHISNVSTPYGGVGAVRYVYFFLLITHIVLSIVVVWFVLRGIFFGITNQIPQHKKAVKWAFPIWLYVSVTGVIVYLMISPYYA